MTPARRKALQWFHDRGEVQSYCWGHSDAPSVEMIRRMVDDGQIGRRDISLWNRIYTLTDKGRRMLHGDDK